MDDKNIEIYDNQENVLQRIQVLKELGYEEEDMYIIASEDEDFSMLRGFTDVIIKEDDDSILDKFKSFLKGEDSIIDAFHRMGLGEGDREFYYDQVKEGKIVLFVNKDYGSYYEVYEDGTYGPIVTEDDPVDVTVLADEIAESDEAIEYFEEDGSTRPVVASEETLGEELIEEAESNPDVDEMEEEIIEDVGLEGQEHNLENLRRDKDINVLLAEEFNKPI